jgi:hypothetical protein
MYILTNNPQDGDDNISSFDEEEAGCSFILASEGNVQDSAQNSSRNPLKQKGISVNFQLRPRFHRFRFSYIQLIPKQVLII